MLSETKLRLSQSYALSWLLHSVRLKVESAKPGTPLLIYQMGKVGSTAVLDAIRALGVRNPMYHVHFLAPRQIEDAQRRLKRLCPEGHNANSWCLLESQWVRSQLDRRPDRHWNVITLVRDPVTRAVSSFFYNIQRYMPDFYRQLASGQIDSTKLVEMFLREFPEHDYTLDWFDRELNAVFGVDVFDKPFPHSQGYALFQKGNVRVLVLKLETLPTVGRAGVNALLSLQNFVPAAANTADERDYKDAYRKFMNEALLPKSYLDKMYGSRLARHFYVEEELATFRARWKSDG